MKKRGMHRYAKPAVKQVDVRATSLVVETLRQNSLQSVRLGGSESLIQRELVELLTSADLFAVVARVPVKISLRRIALRVSASDLRRQTFSRYSAGRILPAVHAAVCRW